MARDIREVHFYSLETTSIVRKYLGPLDSPVTLLISEQAAFVFGSTPLQVVVSWAAMSQHWSQLVWYRVLFIVFSRYLYLNTLHKL